MRQPLLSSISALTIALLYGFSTMVTVAADPPAAARKKSDIPISRETTYFLGPTDAHGYIDYAAALDVQRRGRTTTADNALPGLWQAYGTYDIHSPKNLPPAEYFSALGIAPPTPDGDYLVSESAFLKAYDSDLHDGIWKDFWAAEERVWTAREFPVVFAWLQRNNSAIDRAVEATKKPRYYRPIVRKVESDSLIVAMFPGELTTIRAVSKHLKLRAHYRLGEGRFADAWSDLLALRRLARLAATSPTLIEVLVAYTLDDDVSHRNFLETARLDQAAWRRCLTALKELPLLTSQADAMDIGERAYQLDTLQEMSRGDYSVLKVMEGPLTDENRRAIARNDYPQAMRAANRWFDRVVAALRLPNAAERVAALDLLEKERKKLDDKFMNRPGDPDRRIDRLREGELSDFMLTSDTLLPPLLHRQHDEREQQFSLSKIGLALAAYRAEHGRFPAQLDDLRPQYFTSLPGDLYSGGALHYRLEPDGYTLYSVGPNGRDDLGENNLRDADADVRTDDIVLRIRLPAE